MGSPIDHSTHYIGYLHLLTDSLSAYGIQKFMKGRKETVVAKVVDTWNHVRIANMILTEALDTICSPNSITQHFFEPRKMRIILMKGSVKLSGSDDRPVGNLHTPTPSKVSTWTLEQESKPLESSFSSTSVSKDDARHAGGPFIAVPHRGPSEHDDKGKQKETEDETFRLFVVPI